MTEDNIKNLIIRMNGNKKFVGDHFAQFFYFWIGFNAWLAYRSKATNDREMIECLATKNMKTRDFITAYDNALCDKQKIFINAVSSLAVKTREEPTKIQLKDNKRTWQPIIIRDENDSANVVRAIYGIRCGLFHGRMDINDGENEARVNLARCILDTWVEYLIRGWRRQ